MHNAPAIPRHLDVESHLFARALRQYAVVLPMRKTRAASSTVKRLGAAAPEFMVASAPEPMAASAPEPIVVPEPIVAPDPEGC